MYRLQERYAASYCFHPVKVTRSVHSNFNFGSLCEVIQPSNYNWLLTHTAIEEVCWFRSIFFDPFLFQSSGVLFRSSLSNLGEDRLLVTLLSWTWSTALTENSEKVLNCTTMYEISKQDRFIYVNCSSVAEFTWFDSFIVTTSLKNFKNLSANY